MQIVIPKKLEGDTPYSRKEMEAYIRDNIMTRNGVMNHMMLRQFALKYYKLHSDYYLACPIIVILHWVLDRMIDESNKIDTIKVVGEKFGLAQTKASDEYKIRGFKPRENNDEFIMDFTKSLAQFISRQLALEPGENEGIQLDNIRRYVEPDSGVYVPPPTPPGVSIASDIAGFSPVPMVHAPQPMPPPVPTRRPRGRPPTKLVEAQTQQTTLSLELLSRSLTGEINDFNDKVNLLQDHINNLEARLYTIEGRFK